MGEALDATICLRGIGACLKFRGAEDFVDRVSMLMGEKWSIVREEASLAAPSWNVVVGEDIGGASGGKRRCSYWEKGDVATESVNVCKQVKGFTRGDRKSAEIVTRHYFARYVRKG